ncbi:ATP-dependent helicase HrpB [Terasakiella sp. A23]|uniref:ATP-dependent helicase HrpB n=1 Tax=Terasakiella sp. FCG-A23 TaxID=3080561 RepID=UPI002954E25C|nr:ATP-dependent helicase HrpB [Terasakiella sp. A23]MDV7341551.1 ATP-dependent helicase HrpB [Terasakiella sp. A23]
MTKPIALPDFPVIETFPDLKAALSNQNIAILEAPPGAGKTTLVPLALLNEDWLSGQKIIMLEPRRLAAKMAATRMASIMGEKLGETVGYRIRQDKEIGPNTRIEVVTEGILTRMIQNDPELSGVGLVIFDEFHERNLQGDLGLAFCLETLEALRDDLRVLVMSATLDGQVLSEFLDGAQRIISEGRAFPVETRNLPRPDKFSLAQDTASAVRKAMREEDGNILVFLPGEGEIRKTEQLLNETYHGPSNIIVAPLYGALPPKQQDLAIAPTEKGVRKIVLATTIAETSLTIEGIRVVIDCGLKRVSRFDGARALSKLETVRVSKASAEQRRGRAGRMEPGVCYQLWPRAETQALAERDRPEILEADIAPFLLELAAWGVKDASSLKFLDLPTDKVMADAHDLLKKLNALDEDLSLTKHGERMQRLALHPRLAHMVLVACDNADEDGLLACDIAATLHDGPILKGKQGGDLRDSITCLQGNGNAANVSKAALYRAKDTAKSLKAKQKLPKTAAASAMETGRILALAYPDRIGKIRGKTSCDYLLSNGMGAALREDNPLRGEEFLVVAHLDGQGAKGRIFTAAPMLQSDLEASFGNQIAEEDHIQWDQRSQGAIAERQKKFGALVLKSTPIKNVDPEQIKLALCKGIRQAGLHVLPWEKETENLCNRLKFLKKRDDEWPDYSEDTLAETLEDWLAPFLDGCSKLDHLKKIDLNAALLAGLNWDDQQKLNKLAPTHYRVPSGSNVQLDYSNPDKPVLKVKLQEMFGEPQTPTINNGTVPLCIHLLSPAGRPLQVTENLGSFWQEAYDSVKKEMKGRYPKHPWPDNPIEAIATAKTKRHLR